MGKFLYIQLHLKDSSLPLRCCKLTESRSQASDTFCENIWIWKMEAFATNSTCKFLSFSVVFFFFLLAFPSSAWLTGDIEMSVSESQWSMLRLSLKLVDRDFSQFRQVQQHGNKHSGLRSLGKGEAAQVSPVLKGWLISPDLHKCNSHQGHAGRNITEEP